MSRFLPAALPLLMALALTPASAATSDRCTDGTFCLYEHRDYEGRRLLAYDRSGTLQRDQWDMLSSAVNKTNSTLCIYNAGNNDGNFYLIATLPPHRALSYIGDRNNDMADAWMLAFGKSCPTILR